MNKRLKTILQKMAVIELEIEGKEFEINVEEILDIESSDYTASLPDANKKFAFLATIESMAQYKARDLQAQLATFEAEKDEEVRTSASGRLREASVSSMIRSNPEWLTKKQELNMAKRELELITGLKDSLKIGIDACLAMLLKGLSTKLADHKLEEQELTSMAVERFANKKLNKATEEKEEFNRKKKEIKHKKKKNVYGSRNHAHNVEEDEEDVDDDSLEVEEDDEDDE